ncbi:MAG: SHOCT domain-containing protein, partial [Chloroflexota bacterium]
VFSAVLTAGIFGALGFVAWQFLRHTLPRLAVPRQRDKRSRNSAQPDAESETSPVDVLRRRYAAGQIGQTAFRQQLTDLLKERYVRGDLTLTEFEARVSHLYLDPALQPPRA